MFYSRLLKGSKLERKAKEQLERAGYLVTRAAGSHGMFDLIATNKAGVRFIQVKTDRISQTELEKIRAFDNLPDNGTKEVWIYARGQGFKIVSVSTSPLKEICELFLDSSSITHASASLATYERVLSRFGEFLKRRGIDFLKLDLQQAREFLKELYDSDASAQTISNSISALRYFYAFMTKHNILSHNVFDAIQHPKLPEKLPEILREVEMAAFLDSVKDPLGAAITELIYAAGLRTGELLQLRGPDIDHTACTVRVFDDRGNKRIVPCTARALDKVRAYRNSVGKGFTGPLFLNERGKAIRKHDLNEIMRQCSVDSGLNREITPRLIRSSLAVHLLDAGMDLIALKHLLGVETIASLMPYTQLCLNEKSRALACLDKDCAEAGPSTGADQPLQRIPKFADDYTPIYLQAKFRFGKRS